MDHHQIYWSNSTEGTIYSLTKYPEQILPTFVSGMTSINATGVHDISVIGTHLQPYPGKVEILLELHKTICV